MPLAGFLLGLRYLDEFLKVEFTLAVQIASFSTNIFDLVHLKEEMKSRPIFGLLVLCNY